MTAADKVAAVCVGAACAAPDLAAKLEPINAILHTGTLLVGFLSGIAACIYYWTNRKSRK